MKVAVCPFGVAGLTSSSKYNVLVLFTPIVPVVCEGFTIVTYGSFAKDNVTVVFSSLGPLPSFFNVIPRVLFPADIVAGEKVLSFT